MNKLFSKIATLSVGLAMAIGVGVAVGSKEARVAKADSDTFSFSTNYVSSVKEGDLYISHTWSDSIATFVQTQGNGSDAVANYTTAPRWYANHDITVTPASGVTITAISFTTSKGSLSWSGEESQAFVINPTAQVRPTSATITYSSGSTDVLQSITVTGSMTKTSYTTAESWSAAGLVATGTYQTAGAKDITDKVTWSFNPATPAVTVTSVVATATLGTVSGNSAAQAVTVEKAPAAPGTEDNPYTVAQARAAIDASSGTSNVYATGIVSQIVTAYDSSHKNVTFNISADGLTTSVQLQAYREKSDYSSTVKAGDTVVVYGSLTKYNSTYEFAQNCAITSLTAAPEPETVESIQEIYSATVGSPVEINGYFVGAVSDGIYLMDGEYGIFVYKGTAPEGATVNETKLHVSGTSTTFNNLYQIAQGATITVNASAEVATPINYTLTGSESTADLSVASRRILEKGVISKITRDGTDYTSSYEGEVPTVDTSKDIFLTINGVQVIYKKSDVTQAVFEVLFGYLLNSKKVNVESFTGFYQTSFQLRFSSVVEATEGYTAEQFASDLLTKTDAVCEGYDGVTDNKAALAPIWLELQTNVLSDEEIDRFNDTSNDFTAARKRYDYLVGKYGLTDFIGRNPAPIPGGAYYKDGITDNNSTMIVVISIAATSALAFTMLLVFKKKKQK